MNIPLTGVRAPRGARPPLRRAGVRGQRRQLRGAGRGPARGRRPGERASDAHARHRRGRRGGDRRPDLPRCARDGRGARPLHDRPRGPAVSRATARAAAASRPTAAGRRSSATPRSSPATCRTAGLGRALDEHGRVSGRALVAAAREGDARRPAGVRALRAHARGGHRRLRERVRARAHRDRRAACRTRPSCIWTARWTRPDRALCPALWRRVTVSLARGGADAGVIGAGVLAAQERARDTAAREHHIDPGSRMTTSTTATDLDELSINTIRTLSMDAVQKANSGPSRRPHGARADRLPALHAA